MRQNSKSLSRIAQFIEHEATGGLLLACAAAFAILLVNFGLEDTYHHILEERVRIGVGDLTLDKSLHHFINDGLMAVFFFLVGLEIKREVLEGNLSTPSQIVLPAVAALGGIIVPSGIYAWVNWNNAATLGGWAIPAATDIAFALGALALLGNRAPLSLKIFLLTLATFDDLAAIIIIALFYTSGLSLFALIGGLACLAALVIYNRMGGESIGIYILVGLLMWLFVLKSGVHATLAGVALGLLIPLKRKNDSSPLHDLEHALHPYVKFAILPLFAFANAGLPLDGFSWANLGADVPLGIIAGLTLGKPGGIMLAVVLMVATGLAKLPQGVNWRYMLGVSCLAGIGFTMSLFIGSLAFAESELGAQVRVGVVGGSLLSILLGFLIMWPGKVDNER
ncbi:Na+/H+ antiporter NhaA [Aestuariivirga sp.]|uniref:Na+/H+ antiporter NhaA n=1 Tax=Aestuariivirga sp. TaxID=2650926 RepID=UPI0039E25854